MAYELTIYENKSKKALLVDSSIFLITSLLVGGSQFLISRYTKSQNFRKSSNDKLFVVFLAIIQFPKRLPVQFQISHLLTPIIKEKVEKFFMVTSSLCSEGFPSEEKLSSIVSIIPIGKILPLLKSYLLFHMSHFF